MTLNIRRLIENAELIKETLTWLNLGQHDASNELEAIECILAYFQERYTPPSEPGSYKQARGIIDWQPGDEPAEVSIRRVRGDVIESGVNIETRFEGGTTCDRPAPPEPTPAPYPPGYTRK